MRKSAIALLSSMLLLASCGTSTPSALDGNWAANLQTSDGTDVIGFVATYQQHSGTSVTVSNFTLSFPSGSPNSCLSGQTTENATFSPTANSAGNFEVTISSSQNNVLTAEGTLQPTNNQRTESINGEWTLTGASGCNASGTFSMTPLPPV